MNNQNWNMQSQYQPQNQQYSYQQNYTPQPLNYGTNYQQTAPPQQEKVRLQIKIQNNERGFYSLMLSQADPTDSQRVRGKEAVEFMQRSGLSKDILKNIWNIACFNGEYLDRDDFYVALRLIAYAQNGIDVSALSIQNNIPVGLPKFEPRKQAQQSQSSSQSNNQEGGEQQDSSQEQQKKGGLSIEEMTNNLLAGYNKTVPENKQIKPGNQGSQIQPPVSAATTSTNVAGSDLLDSQPVVQNQNSGSDSEYAVSEDLKQRYAQYFQMSDNQNTGQVSGADAKVIFNRSGLDKQVLVQIWQLTDIGSKGSLNKGEFMTALHLISLAGKGTKIPDQLPQVLKQFIDAQNNPSQPSENKFDAFDNIPTQPSQPAQPQVQQQQQPQINTVSGGNNNNTNDNLLNEQFSQQNSQFNSNLNDLNSQISTQKEKLQTSIQSNQNYLDQLKEMHQNIIKEKQEELEYINNLVSAQDNLCKMVQGENDQLKQDLSKIENEKGEALQQLANLGQQLWVGLNEQTNLKNELVQKASQSIQDITNQSQQALQNLSLNNKPEQQTTSYQQDQTYQQQEQTNDYQNQGYQYDQYGQNTQQDNTEQQQQGFGNEGATTTYDQGNQDNNNQQQSSEQPNWGDYDNKNNTNTEQNNNNNDYNTGWGDQQGTQNNQNSQQQDGNKDFEFGEVKVETKGNDGGWGDFGGFGDNKPAGGEDQNANNNNNYNW